MKQQQTQNSLKWREVGIDFQNYDPATYESGAFTFSTDDTLKSVEVQGKPRWIEQDAAFIRSVDQTCWNHFGFRRHQQPLTDQECQTICLSAQKIAQKTGMDDRHLLGDNLIEQQYLTYDNVFFFLFLKILFVNALIMVLGYAVPALYFFGKGTRYLDVNQLGCDNFYCQFIDRFSTFNEEQPYSTFIILEYLGLGMIAILQVIFYLTWKYNKEIRQMIKYEERCFQCSLLIKGLPEGKYYEEDLLKLFEQKANNQSFQLKNINRSDIQKVENDPEPESCEIVLVTKHSMSLKANSNTSTSNTKPNTFRIKAIQVLYDLRKVSQMIETIHEAVKQIWGITEDGIHEGKDIVFVSAEKQYREHKQKIIDLCTQLKKWRIKFLENRQNRKLYSLGSAFIHFQTRQARDKLLKLLQKLYKTEWINSWGSVQPIVRIPNKQVRQGQVVKLDDYELKVGLAPEPENIMWENVENTSSEWASEHKKCRVLMIVVPIIQLAIVFGLEVLKQYLWNIESTLFILSFLVNFVLIGVNQISFFFLELAVGGQSLRLATSYQVYINYVGFATQALSLTLVPLLVQFAWYDGYFGQGALAGEAFEYQLTTLISMPFFFIVTPGQIFTKILMSWHKTRNFLLRRKFNEEQGQRLKNIYEMFEKPEFEVSESYAFLMANFLHTTCFCMLTPIIIPMYALQIIIFYWACKIRMVKLCQFPKLIRRWLMGIVFANLLVSPLFFAAGCLITQHAYNKYVVLLDRIPLGVYLIFVLWALFTFLSLVIDTKLEDKQIFTCLNYIDNFTSLKDLQACRNRQYPTVSTSYYIRSNVLKLLGFEKTLTGTIRNRKAEELYESFCQAEVGRQNKVGEKLAEMESFK